MLKHKILVVEDEENLQELIVFNLENEGYSCTAVTNGNDVMNTVHKVKPSLILLDIMLPGKNGFELAQSISQISPKIPVIFLTARVSDTDKIKGLKSGAVDYISKPFNLEELLLRVKIHLPKSTENVLKIGKITVYCEKHMIVNYEGHSQEIGRKELALLQLLFEQESKVISREVIMSRIWGDSIDTTYRTIDNYILSLRKLIGDDSKNPRYLHAVRGIGYKLTL